MFKVLKKIPKSLGRASVLSTKNGDIETPAFVSVGTKATVKSLTPEEVREAKSQVVLANTYHLYLEPGEKIIKEAGGLHKFMNWKGPTMTDSGGFQAFSLGLAYGEKLSKFIGLDYDGNTLDIVDEDRKERKAKISEGGIEFKSVIDGSTHFFSPEKSIQIQNDIGADIIFVLDECTSPLSPQNYLEEANQRTHRWAERCFNYHKNKDQYLFGIVQGGRDESLRKESARFVGSIDFAGFGIGGSFIKNDMANAVNWVNSILPEEKPRHLLGVGEPLDLILGVENGCDTFDCVLPTRLGRNGTLYTKYGKINIKNSKYKILFAPIEENCLCYSCKNYTSAYLAHLYRANEMLASTLGSIHNLFFLNNLMSNIRNSILEDRFLDFKDEFLRNYKIS